jgi:hypothetical protein
MSLKQGLIKKTDAISLFLRIFAAAIIFLPPPAFAAASVNGSTGIINVPTADVLRKGRVSYGAYWLEDGNRENIVLGLDNRFEIGASSEPLNEGKTSVQLKFALRQEGVLKAGLAAGIDHIAGSGEKSPYIAATKTLPFGIRVTSGIGEGHYNGLFGAVEAQIVSGGKKRALLLAEHDGSTLNYGVRFTRQNVGAELGWRAKKMFFGVTGNF